MEKSLQVALINPSTRAEGPGLRFALWVQGCPIRCLGCFNPHMFDFAGGQDITVSQLLDQIDEAVQTWPEIEGVTLLGGEPFAQAESLAIFAQAVRERGKSVLTFSGFTYEHLQNGRLPGSKQLLQQSDVLIAGPYLQDKLDFNRPLLGSTNQEYVFLTDFYSLNDFQIFDQLEFTVHENGQILVNGWADVATLQDLTLHLNKISGIP